MTQVLEIPAATPKQIAFIDTLLNEKITTGTIFEGHTKAPEALNIRTAGEAINTLLTLQSGEKKPAKAKYKESALGFYSHGEDLYEVCMSAQKNKYAKKLTVRTNSEGKIVKVSWLFSPGAMKTFQDWQPVDLDQAKQWGKKYGFCMRCGRLLTAPESVEAGIGPVCAGGF